MEDLTIETDPIKYDLEETRVPAIYYIVSRVLQKYCGAVFPSELVRRARFFATLFIGGSLQSRRRPAASLVSSGSHRFIISLENRNNKANPVCMNPVHRVLRAQREQVCASPPKTAIRLIASRKLATLSVRSLTCPFIWCGGDTGNSVLDAATWN